MRRARIEKIYPKMTKQEWDFLEDMKTNHKMYCDNFVYRKWLKTVQRKKNYLQAMEKRLEKEENYEKTLQENVQIDEVLEEYCQDDIESNYEQSESTSDESPTTSTGKKRRKLIHHIVSSSKSDMAIEYQHPRDSVMKVRPELYECMDTLRCKYHMSEKQAHASVVFVANKLFNRSWKFNIDSEVIDVDTLPEPRSVRYASKGIEAMALAEIVKEIMESDQNSVVTYHEDGSKKQGAGSFSVQGVSINGKYRALPTLTVASENHMNLADLKITVFDILEAASGISSNTLIEKIDFVLTDQTAHNLEVEKSVAEKLQTEYEPSHLFCNVHASLMFNRVLTKEWSEIENTIGRNKIYSSFLVNATTNHASVTEQALDCTTRLINHDFDHKSWNKAKDFDEHISPKKNKSVSLKDERFNRLTLTCAVTIFHFDDVGSFLTKYEHITNQLACIVRCFHDLDFLKVLYVTGALIGLHLTEPFLSLTTSAKTDYAKLIPAMKQLYTDLLETDVEQLLNVHTPAFSFISNERFQHSKYDDDICGAIQEVANIYKKDVLKVLRVLLPKLANGLQKQKGDIFEFGEFSESAYALSKMDQQKLSKAPIHNLNPERSVGFINYELVRRGAKQLKASSSAQVKAKAHDLIESLETGTFQLYNKVGNIRIPEIINDWNVKQNQLIAEGMKQKEISNISVDRRRNNDLEKLKSLGGPFTSVEEVDNFIKEKIPEAEKVKRLYTEVRYARDSALSIPKTSDIFRLKKQYKNLDSATYASNLKLYLGNVGCRTNVTLEDFSSALDKLHG